MSDVSKTNELIGSLNRVAGLLDEYAFENNASEAPGLMRKAADALATRVPVQGEPPVICEWCTGPARGEAWHNDGKLHPSCGQIDHGQGWVPPTVFALPAVQGEPNDDREAEFDLILRNKLANRICEASVGYSPMLDEAAADIANQVLADVELMAAFSRATVPDAATAAIERVRALHQAAWDSVSAMYPTPLCGCGEEFNECPTAQVLPPSSASNAAGLNHEGTAP